MCKISHILHPELRDDVHIEICEQPEELTPFQIAKKRVLMYGGRGKREKIDPDAEIEIDHSTSFNYSHEQ